MSSFDLYADALRDLVVDARLDSERPDDWPGRYAADVAKLLETIATKNREIIRLRRAKWQTVVRPGGRST